MCLDNDQSVSWTFPMISRTLFARGESTFCSMEWIPKILHSFPTQLCTCVGQGWAYCVWASINRVDRFYNILAGTPNIILWYVCWIEWNCWRWTRHGYLGDGSMIAQNEACSLRAPPATCFQYWHILDVFGLKYLISSDLDFSGY